MNYFPYMAGTPANGSNRPLAEIIMKAPLMSMVPEDTAPEPVGKWFGKSFWW